VSNILDELLTEIGVFPPPQSQNRAATFAEAVNAPVQEASTGTSLVSSVSVRELNIADLVASSIVIAGKADGFVILPGSSAGLQVDILVNGQLYTQCTVGTVYRTPFDGLRVSNSPKGTTIGRVKIAIFSGEPSYIFKGPEGSPYFNNTQNVKIGVSASDNGRALQDASSPNNNPTQETLGVPIQGVRGARILLAPAYETPTIQASLPGRLTGGFLRLWWRPSVPLEYDYRQQADAGVDMPGWVPGFNDWCLTDQIWTVPDLSLTMRSGQRECGFVTRDFDVWCKSGFIYAEAYNCTAENKPGLGGSAATSMQVLIHTWSE